MSKLCTNAWSFKEGRAMSMPFQPESYVGFDSQRELVLVVGPSQNLCILCMSKG